MTKPRTALLFLFFLLVFLTPSRDSRADTADCPIRVSVITCGTGNALYSYFGHTAIRITDSARNMDLVYNYGTFDFDDPDFYLKFAQGKLLYFISYSDYPSFKSEYVQDHRSLSEQVLRLNCEQKSALEEFLAWNALPQNMFYRYDFFLDNCTTRIRDIFPAYLGKGFSWNEPHDPGRVSFRQAINRYLARDPWTGLGINLLLGSGTDQLLSPQTSMFLPDSLMHYLGRATLEGKPLVKQTRILYLPPRSSQGRTWLSPLVVFSLWLLLILWISWNAEHLNPYLIVALDGVFFFLTGILGILFLLMWFDTDHSMTKWNDNLLWAFPLNILLAFLLPGRKTIVKRYAALAAILTAFYLVGTWFLPQKPQPALIPVLLALLVRLTAVSRSKYPYRERVKLV